MKLRHLITALALGIAFWALAGHLPVAHAQDVRPGLYNSAGTLLRYIPNILPGSSLTTADVNGDGVQEIIVGSPAGASPEVRILTLQGVIIRKLFFLGAKTKPAIHVSVGDVNGDGQPELIVSFGPGTTPEVWVMSTRGTDRQTFYAYDKQFRYGVITSVADVSGDGVADIVTAPETGGGPNIKAFTGNGKRLVSFFAYPNSMRSGLNILAANVSGNGVAEIIVAPSTRTGVVKVFNDAGVVLQTFTATAQTLRSMRIASVGSSQIIMGSAAGVPGVVVSYNTDGTPGTVQFYPYGKAYNRGVTIATVANGSDPDIIVVPGSSVETLPVGTGKRIVVDISEQKLYQYDGTALVGTHRVSTGKWSMPTPIGTFATRTKISTAYSRAYHLYMDNWMGFTPDGKYGIHSLPYWRLKNGSIYYEGVAHLGIRVSHGCIRLSPTEAKQVYAWAPVGTAVTVQN